MKKKVIIGSLIAVVIIAVVAANIVKNAGSVTAFSSGKTFEVTVKQIEKGSISSSISASGVIEEVDKQEVYFETPLKVKKLLVEKNQKVTKGQKLAEFDMDSLLSELEKAKVTREVQELAIKKLQSSDGTAANNLRSAQLNYDEKKKNYDNSKNLFDSGAVSRTELDQAKKAYDDAEIALNNARLALGSQSIDVQSQQQNLKSTLLAISDIENKIKKIEESSASPIDGVISEINVQEGGFTSSMTPTFKFINADKLKVKADVKEFDIKKVEVGQEVAISGDAIEKSDGVTGKVTSISPAAKKNTTATGDETLIEIEVEIVKGHPVLKPGLSVTCDVVTNVRNDVPLVTFEMLREDKDGNKFVFVVGKDNILEERPVKLGVTSELDAEVVEGLKEGETVVEKVQPSMKSGSKAKIIKGEEE